jgi:hypothetical protein
MSGIGRGIRVIGATALAFGALAAPVGAAELPRGDYACFLTGGGAGGSIQIKGGNKYTINHGKKGKYTYAKKSKIVNFKTGDYKGFFGKYVKKSKGIDIFDSKHGDYLWTCNR